MIALPTLTWYFGAYKATKKYTDFDTERKKYVHDNEEDIKAIEIRIQRYPELYLVNLK